MKSNNIYQIALICISVLFLVSISIVIHQSITEINPKNNPKVLNDTNTTNENKDTTNLPDSIIKAVAKVHILTEGDEDCPETIYISDNKQSDIAYLIDKEAGSSKKIVFTGKRINIAVTGLDGRIGRPSKLADANHVISIMPESGRVEIISIPRDSYVDLGYTTGDSIVDLNKITYCRANKGRDRYHKELANIAGIDKIHY